MLVLAHTHHIANVFLAELRNTAVQQDRMRFRQNLQRVGQALAYELSKTMAYEKQVVTTPLGNKEVLLPVQQPVLVTVLRASLPLYNGFLEVFDKADSAFIGAYRGAHKADNSFDIALDYVASPSLDGREVVLLDPMLATGKSLVKAYESLLQYGTPSKLHVVAAIAANQGVEYVQEKLPQAHIWLGDVDAELNDHSYIVPGLGDAGDLSFGPKL